MKYEVTAESKNFKSAIDGKRICISHSRYFFEAINETEAMGLFLAKVRKSRSQFKFINVREC